MSRCCTALLLALAVSLGASAFPPVPKPKENKAADRDLAKAIQGTWEVTKIERGSGKNQSPAGLVLRLAIDGEKLTQHSTINGREQSALPSRFVMDAKKRPATFEMKYSRGKKE